MIRETLILFVVLTSVVLPTISSQLPATDVYKIEVDANQQPAVIYFMNDYNVGKYNNQPSFIKSYNTINQQIDDSAQGLDGSQDFCLFGPREDLLMAVGPEIFRFNRNSNSWIVWQDLAKFGILNITRISSLDNTLLIVNNRP
jgi:hypothetical protein